MKLFRRRRKNNKGFSLVEVVCAIAIMGLATTAVGSAMIMSTRSYQRGSAEVDVQKEAQTTTNLIGNLLVDAVMADYQEVAGTSKTLTIDGEGITYVLSYDENTDVITYSETVTGGTPITGVLAENVTNFDVDLSDFTANKNAKVELAIEKNGKHYEATYSTTARNGASVNTGAVEVAKIICESEVTLEPGHSYTIPIVVHGIPAAEAGIDFSAVSAVGSDSEVGGSYLSGKSEAGVTINLTSDAKGTLAFNIVTKKDAAGNYLDTKAVTINVRRVNDIDFTRDLESGTATKKDAVYCIYADAIGTNLDKKIGRAYDNDYKNPRFMDLDVSMTGGDVAAYVQVLDRVEDVDRPYIRIKLLENMPGGSVINITATSKHAEGTIAGVKYTKQGYGYGPVTDVHPIDNTDVITSDNGLKRGNDCLDFETILDLEALKNQYGGEITWLFRYKPEGGSWSQYYRTKESGSEQKVNAIETYLFDIDKTYEYELMFACIDWTNKTLEWPHDPSLLAAGKGFAEYGITQGWTADEVGVGLSATSPEQYSETFQLGKTEINFTGEGSWTSSGDLKNLAGAMGYDEKGNPNSVLCAGSADNTLVLDRSDNHGFSIAFSTVNLDKGQYGYAYVLEKYDGSGNWVSVAAPGFTVQLSGGASSAVQVYNITGAEIGKYRIGIQVVNNKYGTVDASSNIKDLVINTSSNGNWEAHGTKVVNEGGVNKSVEYGYVYFSIVE